MNYYESVLNTLDDDLQRFNDLKANAKHLTLICKDGEKCVKGFIQIIGDIWFAFYSKDVRIIKKKKNLNPYHAEFIEHLLALEEYKKWHMYTENDDLLSVLTTITIGEQLLFFINQDEKVRKASYLRKFAERKKEIAENKINEIMTDWYAKGEVDKVKFQLNVYKKMLDIETAEIENTNILGLQKIVSYKEQLINNIQASSQVKKTQQAVILLSIINGRKIEHIPLKEQLKFADAMIQNKVLYEIAEMVGRFKKIAKKKMKTLQKQTMERKKITIGNELSRLLPSEFANYILPASRLDFLMRYSESLTLTYDTKGKDLRGRGPMIICMDESSSMNAMRVESKAFCLALLMIAQKQKRDLAIIPFSSDIGEVHYFHKGQIITDHIITFSKQFLGGSTNFEKPLRHSLSILMKGRFNNADVIFVTDGSSKLSNAFIDEFNDVKKRHKFECISVLVMNAYNTVDLSVVHNFSDKVIKVNNLFEAEEVFSL